jgi:hypothetical protein
VQARAIRRCGELLQAIAPAKNQHDAKDRARVDNRPSSSCKSAAEEAGLSSYQRKTALRVAKIPQEEFDETMDADTPLRQ